VTEAETSPNWSSVAVAAAYGILGATLLWSRLAQLGHSFWTDEILMVQTFVRPGLREILTGPGLSHQLMAILCWAASQVVGESEVVFRLFSAVPFVAAVFLVAGWLHRRLGALSGILYLFLATVSPLLVDITRQARGYGLAYLAMSVVVVVALEALRTGRLWVVGLMWAAGLAGAWTLPQVGIAVLATAGVLLLDRRTRLPAAIGIAVTLAAVAAWYIPHAGGVKAIARFPDGVQIGFPWVITAPIDQVANRVLPASLRRMHRPLSPPAPPAIMAPPSRAHARRWCDFRDF
jgi:biotin transporter BioY